MKRASLGRRMSLCGPGAHDALLERDVHHM